VEALRPGWMGRHGGSPELEKKTVPREGGGGRGRGRPSRAK